MHHCLPSLPQLTERPYEEGSLEVPFPQACGFPAGSLPDITAVTCLLVEVDWCKCEGGFLLDPPSLLLCLKRTELCVFAQGSLNRGRARLSLERAVCGVEMQ